MRPLTAKQADLLGYLRVCDEAPSFDEMKIALGLSSKSGVHRLIGALEERGYIRRIPNRARCIELVTTPRLPEENTLSAMPTRALAAEARRRGLVLAEYHRWNARVGDRLIERRRMVEVSA